MYTESVLRELGDFRKFIIHWFNHDNMIYRVVSVLMKGSGRNMSVIKMHCLSVKEGSKPYFYADLLSGCETRWQA